MGLQEQKPEYVHNFDIRSILELLMERAKRPGQQEQQLVYTKPRSPDLTPSSIKVAGNHESQNKSLSLSEHYNYVGMLRQVQEDCQRKCHKRRGLGASAKKSRVDIFGKFPELEGEARKSYTFRRPCSQLLNSNVLGNKSNLSLSLARTFRWENLFVCDVCLGSGSFSSPLLAIRSLSTFVR